MVRLAITRGGRAIERSYTAVLFAVSVLFAVILPPFQAPDEIAHFIRAIGIGEGQCIAARSIRIPASYGREAGTFHPLNGNDPQIVDHRLGSDILQSLQSPSSTETTESASSFSIDVYPCVLYFPAALVLALGSPLHPGIVAALFVARIATLLTCIALLVAGFRVLPFGKPLYAFISLLPMFVAQTASVSGDSTTNALAMFATAVVLRLKFGDPAALLSRVQLIGLGTLATLLALAKLDAVLLLLFLILPAERFGSAARKYATVAGFAAVAFGVSFLWAAANRELAQSVLALQLSGRNVDVAYNMHYVSSRPLDAALALWNSARVRWADWITSTAGTFGWLVTSLPSWAVGAIVALFLYFSVRVPSRTRLGPAARSVLAAAALSGIVLVVVLVFGYELTRVQIAQPPGNIALAGVQGRYFLPFLFPLGLLAGAATSDDERAGTVEALCCGAVLNVIALVTVWQYFYR